VNLSIISLVLESWNDVITNSSLDLVSISSGDTLLSKRSNGVDIGLQSKSEVIANILVVSEELAIGTQNLGSSNNGERSLSL
jgi:hypothetical protein